MSIQIPSPLSRLAQYEAKGSGRGMDTFNTLGRRRISLGNLVIGQDYRMVVSCELANSLAGKGAEVEITYDGDLDNTFLQDSVVSDVALGWKAVSGTFTFQARATSVNIDFYWRRTGGAGVARIRRIAVIPEEM